MDRIKMVDSSRIFFDNKDGGGLCLHLGAYADMLASAVECFSGRPCPHLSIGKPASDYFLAAIGDMHLARDEVVMFGDDIEMDVHAAQTAVLSAVLVRTGKYRPEWEHHPRVQPDLVADNLLAGVNAVFGAE